MKKFLLGTIVLIFLMTFLSAEVVTFPKNTGKNGFNVISSRTSGIEIEFTIEKMIVNDINIDGEDMVNFSIPGMILPNDAGAPNLPGEGRYIAIPEEANANVRIISYEKEVYQDVNLAPAPVIPFDLDNQVLKYEKDFSIYNKNAFYPANIATLSKRTKIRGVDVVILGITPFQYNPITKELIIYKNIKVYVEFNGGNGHFGENRLRNRWWEPILQANLINYDMLPKINFTERKQNRADEYEYIIIIPDDPNFAAWADTIKLFRQKQGILTGIFTTTDLGGNTVSNIENFINNAYNTWTTPPVAVLLLSDYQSSGKAYGITSLSMTHPYSGTYVSDNMYADVDGDTLPDIVFSRITAQDATHLQTMIEKFLNYERTPSTNFNFYDNPVTACGFQTTRWFQLASEIMYGFFEHNLGKNPTRINAIYSGTPTPGDPWSSATNTDDVVAYFGSSGLGYIGDTIPTIPWNGTGTDVVNAINNGTFLLQHRDHGGVTGWGEPEFTMSDFSSLINNLLPFVMSINCHTGRFDYSTEVFTEGFHRMEHGALGVVAASQISYSFVNDAFIFGLYDGMWPQFDPGYPTKGFTGYDNLRPAFAMESGKYYLQASSWPYNPDKKCLTHNLFHMHGDAFLTLYSEVPDSLSVTHSPTLAVGETNFAVTADDSSLIGLTVNGEIIGKAEGTGSSVNITIPAQTNPSDTLIVTVTKMNKFRYERIVPIISSSGPYVSYLSNIIDDALGNNNGQINPGETIDLSVYLKNVGVADAHSVYALVSTTDPDVTINADSSNYGDIAAGDSALSITDYNFTVGTVNNNHNIPFDILITATESTWTGSFSLMVYAPIVSRETFTIDDATTGNNSGKWDAGEQVKLLFGVKNSGGELAKNVHINITTSTSGITIDDGSAIFGDIDTSTTVINTADDLLATSGASIPTGTAVTIDYTISGDNFTDVTGSVSTIVGQLHYIIFDVDENHNSGSVMHTVLTNLGYQGDYYTTFSPMVDSLTNYASAFVFAGIYSNNQRIYPDTGIKFNNYCQNDGGKFYLEGGDVWYWDPIYGGYNFESLCGIDGTTDGSGDLATIGGVATTFTEGMSFSYSGDNSYIDHLSPTGTGYTIFNNSSPAYVCGIASDTRAYRTVGFSFEFGGLTDGSGVSTKDTLALNIMEFFGIHLQGVAIDRFSALKSNRTLSFGIKAKGSNLFSNKLDIEYGIVHSGKVEIDIYNTTGRKIKTLVNTTENAGYHKISWNGTDDSGKNLVNGIYFVTIKSAGKVKNTKVMLIK